MNTAVVNIKTTSELKAQAQSLARELGFSLSALINACLKQMIRSRVVNFSVAEKPTDYMIEALERSKKDIKTRKVIAFKNGNEALNYLDKLIENDKRACRN